MVENGEAEAGELANLPFGEVLVGLHRHQVPYIQMLLFSVFVSRHSNEMLARQNFIEQDVHGTEVVEESNIEFLAPFLFQIKQLNLHVVNLLNQQAKEVS